MAALGGIFRDPHYKKSAARSYLKPEGKLCTLGKKGTERGQHAKDKAQSQAWDKEPDPCQPGNTNAGATKPLAPEVPNVNGPGDESPNESDVCDGKSLTHRRRLTQPGQRLKGARSTVGLGSLELIGDGVV
jgi:hypothetical protein